MHNTNASRLHPEHIGGSVAITAEFLLPSRIDGTDETLGGGYHGGSSANGN